MIIVSINDNEINQRLDKYLLRYLNKAPKSFIYKMLRKKNIKYNDKKAVGNEILKAGDVLQLFLADDTISNFRETIINPVERKFSIIFEDDNVLFVNKPAGVLSHPESSSDHNTLIDQVIFYLFEKGEVNNAFKPVLCNRLDRNTSGIVSIGKNIVAASELNNANKQRLVDKKYLALVTGKITCAGTLEGYLKKDHQANEVIISLSNKNVGNYKKVITKYSPIKFNNDYSLLEVLLVTGRSHQIRAHLKSLGHMVVGDRKYGDLDVNTMFKKNFGLNNQFLHAHKFIYNKKDGALSYLNNMELIAPLPKLLNTIEKKLFD